MLGVQFHACRMLTAKLQNRSGPHNRFTCPISSRQVNIESISVRATGSPNVAYIFFIIDFASHDEVAQIQTSQSSD